MSNVVNKHKIQSNNTIARVQQHQRFVQILIQFIIYLFLIYFFILFIF
jgi:hypothetical protein